MKSVIAAISTAMVLAACGGGDGATPTLQEGLYHHQSFNYFTGSHISSVLVLEHQEVWTQDVASEGNSQFFGQGIFTYTGTGAYATGVAYEGIPYTIFSQTKTLAAINSNVLGEVPTEIRLNAAGTGLTVHYPNITGWGIGGTLLTPETGFDYNKAASLQDVSGAWHGLAIDNTGAVTGTGTDRWSACSLAGTLTPRPSGKNVFNLSLTLTGCADAGEYSGIALSYMASPSSFAFESVGATYIRLIATTLGKTKMFNMTTSK